MEKIHEKHDCDEPVLAVLKEIVGDNYEFKKENIVLERKGALNACPDK